MRTAVDSTGLGLAIIREGVLDDWESDVDDPEGSVEGPGVGVLSGSGKGDVLRRFCG